MHSLARTRIFRGVFWCMIGWFFFSFTEVHAQEHEKKRHFHGQLRSNGRFLSTQQDFPPQHKGIERITYMHSSEDGADHDRRARIHELIRRDAASRTLLGERFAFIGIVEVATKDNPSDTRRKATYYSHSNNQTVEILIQDDAILSSNTFAAREYQPPLAEDEVRAAVSIARQHWSSHDGGRVSTMAGYGILAFEPDGSGFFNDRVVYVTFHRSLEDRPEYVAYVDLTGNTVIRSWEE